MIKYVMNAMISDQNRSQNVDLMVHEKIFTHRVEFGEVLKIIIGA